jgi:hypothetical protein
MFSLMLSLPSQDYRLIALRNTRIGLCHEFHVPLLPDTVVCTCQTTSAVVSVICTECDLEYFCSKAFEEPGSVGSTMANETALRWSKSGAADVLLVEK